MRSLSLAFACPSTSVKNWWGGGGSVSLRGALNRVNTVIVKVCEDLK